MAIRSPAMRSIAPAVRPVNRPGRCCAPCRGAQALRLAGERIATPACALVRNDRLGSAVGLDGVRGSGERAAGARPPPYDTGSGDASGPTHPAPAMHP